MSVAVSSVPVVAVDPVVSAEDEEIVKAVPFYPTLKCTRGFDEHFRSKLLKAVRRGLGLYLEWKPYYDCYTIEEHLRSLLEGQELMFSLLAKRGLKNPQALLTHPRVLRDRIFHDKVNNLAFFQMKVDDMDVLSSDFESKIDALFPGMI